MNSMLKYAPLHRSTPKYTSLADQAYEHILTNIVFPDDTTKGGSGIEYAGKITESTIAKALKMSNGPVREAIFRLRHEGWVQTIGNRGSFFTDFSDPKVAIEIYQFRLSFETGAFYSLAASITDVQVEVLRSTLGELDKAKEQADTVSFRKADIRFHLQVAEFAGGPSYAQLFRSKLMQWYAMAFHLLNESLGPERYRHNLEAPEASSHQELFNALVARDSELAARLITQHQSYIAHMLGIDDGETLISA
jgi:DNA-binding GntR family transcriptional regulator